MYVPYKTKLVSRKRFVRIQFNKEIDLLTNQVKFFRWLSQQNGNLININFFENQIGVFEKRLAGLMAKERILCQGDWFHNFDDV